MKYALLVNINEYDESFWGSGSNLTDTDIDADGMMDLLPFDFKVSRLFDSLATKSAVSQSIIDLANKAVKGDFVLIYYSGHGMEIPTSSVNEIGIYDQALCLHDAPLVDNEVYNLLCRFKSGVKVLLVFDSCFSGSMYKAIGSVGYKQKSLFGKKIDSIIKSINIPKRSGVLSCDLKCMFSSTDKQVSYSTGKGGLFTTHLIKSFGKFAYVKWFDKAITGMPKLQNPIYINLSKNRMYNVEIAFS